MILTEKLHTLCHISSGGTPSRGKSEYYGGDIPWAKIADIEKSNGVIYKTAEYITEAGLKNIRNRIFPKGSLLFSIYGSVGKVAFCGVELSANQAILGIQVKNEAKEKLSLEYLSYWFRVNVQQLNKKAVGGILKNLSATIVKDFDIPLPSLKYQKQIVKVLSDCELLIQKRKDSIILLNELLSSQFLEMFGKPDINPFGWPIKQFGDYTEYIGDIGSNGSNATIAKNLIMSDNEDYAIMVRTTNLNSNDFTTNLKYVSKKTYDFFSKSKIYGGEIIMNKIGSPGKFWIMPKLEKPVSLGLNQLVIRLKDLNINYITYFLSTNFGEINIKSRTKGATTKSITKSAVRSLPILYPPMPLQIQFSELVEKVASIKKQFIYSLQEIENLYGSLSQRAFNGELDLSKIEITDMETKEPIKPEMEELELIPYTEDEIKDIVDNQIRKSFPVSYFTLSDLEKVLESNNFHLDYSELKKYIFNALEGDTASLIQSFEEVEIKKTDSDKSESIKQIMLKLKS